MPTVNPSSDSFLHSPFCFLSSLVAPSSTTTLASGLTSSEFPYHWERVCAFLVVVVDMAGRVSGEPERPAAVGFHARTGPTVKFPK